MAQLVEKIWIAQLTLYLIHWRNVLFIYCYYYWTRFPVITFLLTIHLVWVQIPCVFTGCLQVL